ncbi:MAG: AAA family ATPase [Chloroflexota bacterium]|nr:AAA family ATPase [Chloroflexota bacterium]
MRVERLEIGGFGRFADVAWELEPGLTVMLGENEAGKTTLLNALRAILFGFESSRDGRAWYPALAGGRRGGRMVLLTAAGERWTVERYGQRGGAGSLAVRAPTGNQGGQETLDRLLHGADRDLFNSIFAFGLGELQDFSSLGGEGVRGRIYGAAAGLGGTSAVDLERKLRQEQDDLFRPTGRLQPINQLFGRMDDLHGRITALTRQPQEFEEAHRERSEAHAAAATHREAAQAARAHALRLQRLLDASPIVATLDELDAELAETDPSLDVLPADAVAVLDRRLAALAEERARLQAVDEQLADIGARAAGLRVDEQVLAAADEIRALHADRVAHASSADRLREASGTEARHAATVVEQLARVGGWDEARLVALDDSIASVEAIREHERLIGQARDAATTAERSHRSAADELAAREREGLLPGDDRDEGTDARDALRQIERLRALRSARGAGVRLPPRAGRRVGVAVLIGAPLLGLAIGMAIGQPVLVGGMGLLLAVAAAAVLAALTAASLDVTQEAELLARAGLPPGASDDEVARRADEVAELRARRSLVRDQARSMVDRREEVRRLGETAAAARAALDAATAAWDAWLEARGMPPGSTPEVARQLLAAAGTARRAARERDEQHRVLETIRRQGADLDRRAVGLLDRFSIAQGGAVEGRLASLLERLDQSSTDRRTAQELEVRRLTLAERRRPVETSVAQLAAAVAEHLAALGCADADQLRGRAAAAAARRSVQQRLRETRERLSGLAGGHDAVDALRSELRGRELSEVEADLAAAQAEVEAFELEERRLVARVGELDARIQALESADELGTLRQELAALQGQAGALAHEWAVRALTGRLLAETRSRYERERQPDVVRAATAHFERITGGRYTRIVAPPGDASVRIETESGEGRITDELSRGTAEQLYLALRFGLIEEFARHAEALPVVMDDILVNFDADRAARAAATIRDLAERHQVLYFTCHPWTAGLLDPAGGRTLSLG